VTLATLPAVAAETHAHPASPWPVFWVASVAAFLVSLDSTMLYSAFGALRASFPDATAADMSWVLNAYTVAYAAMLIPAGGLADAHGRKRVFLFGVTVFIAASAACGLAGSVGWLIAARVLQAAGAALLTPASLSIVLAAFPQNKRALTVSLWGAVAGFAAAVGPSLGSFVVQSVGWPWAFFINLPIGALSLWRGAALLSESARTARRRKVDLVGMALLIVAVGAIALAIVESESPAWTRAQLAAAAATGVIALVAFIVWAKNVREPLVDLSLFRDRTYSAVNAATLSFGIAFAMMFFAFFFYMSNVWHYSQALAGLAIAPGPLMVIPVASVTGRLAGRYGHRPFLVGGALLYAADRPVVHAGSRRRTVVCVSLVAGPVSQRRQRGDGDAVAFRRSGQQAAGAALRGRQRGQSGDAPNRGSDRRRDHGTSPRPRSRAAQRLQRSLWPAHWPGAVDRCAVCIRQHASGTPAGVTLRASAAASLVICTVGAVALSDP
jgi:EmrB/QacA subfamily drug resistance transporter